MDTPTYRVLNLQLVHIDILFYVTVFHFFACILKMQQYIDISPYRDTLGDDTVSIHI